MAVRYDTSELTDFLGNFGKKLESDMVDKKLMADIGDAIAVGVKKRTEEGKDVNHKKFKGYSDSYRKRRKKRGRQTERVDLNFTGRMMASLARGDTRKDEVKVGIFAANQQGKAAGHQHGSNDLPERRFIGISNKDRAILQEIDRILDERSDDVLNDIVRFQVA